MEQTLENILGDREISEFSKNFVETSRNSEQETAQTYCILRYYGLSKDKIATNASLLGCNPETIQRNYENLISLLRDNYQDRNSGRKLSLNSLGRKQETCENNIQFLDRLGIDYNKNPLLLSTTAKKKREKMAWLLKNCFDYSEKPVEDRKETINQMYDLVRTNSSYLIKSINSLESSKDKIRKKIHEKRTN